MSARYPGPGVSKCDNSIKNQIIRCAVAVRVKVPGALKLVARILQRRGEAHFDPAIPEYFKGIRIQGLGKVPLPVSQGIGL